MNATYSPDDNKLRLYSVARLDAETYARVKAAGFRWAPKQSLFVAPMWTPQREDLLLELCGEIGDEDTSLVDRAEERAERFETYSEKRQTDADRAHAAVERITSGIPMGQPILVGHHSERHARKDAERIENGTRKAVRMWETSKYWTSRAAGAIQHAKYKERPDVRSRRIKTIEADKRKAERDREQTARTIRIWERLPEPDSLKRKDGQPMTFLERAIFICGNTRNGGAFGNYSDLRDGKITPEELREKIIASSRQTIAWRDRWIAHYDNRLRYERAMLAESGWTEPPKLKTAAALPLLNYSGAVSYRNPYSGEIVTGQAVPITKADLAKINSDYKGTRVSACGTHRVRTAMHVPGQGRALCIVYLSDSKQHPRPDAATVASKAEEEAAAAMSRAEANREHQIARIEQRATAATRDAEADAKAATFRALKETAKRGVRVVAAPQLFPTPPDLATRMIELAEIVRGMRVLEPSAGTGSLLAAVKALHNGSTVRVAVEINHALCSTLRRCDPGAYVEHADFLEWTSEPFDRIVMNPPFENGADIRHIEHARTMLKPGGRLVAICANGPRQRAKLLPLVEECGGEWIDLPPGTFRTAGTSANTALLYFDAPAPEVERSAATKPQTIQASLF